MKMYKKVSALKAPKNGSGSMITEDDFTPMWPKRIPRVTHYYTKITLIDECVGHIMDALEKRGYLENTRVVYS